MNASELTTILTALNDSEKRQSEALKASEARQATALASMGDRLTGAIEDLRNKLAIVPSCKDCSNIGKIKLGMRYQWALLCGLGTALLYLGINVLPHVR